MRMAMAVDFALFCAVMRQILLKVAICVWLESFATKFYFLLLMQSSFRSFFNFLSSSPSNSFHSILSFSEEESALTSYPNIHSPCIMSTTNQRHLRRRNLFIERELGLVKANTFQAQIINRRIQNITLDPAVSIQREHVGAVNTIDIEEAEGR